MMLPLPLPLPMTLTTARSKALEVLWFFAVIALVTQLARRYHWPNCYVHLHLYLHLPTESHPERRPIAAPSPVLWP